MDRLAVMVSGGRDSMALAHMCYRASKENDIVCTYIHNYLVPDLDVNEMPLRALEKTLGIKIIRLPSPLRRQMLDGDALCINRVWEARFKCVPRPAAYFRMIAAIAKSPWMTTGIARADSIRRRLALTQAPNPNANAKRVYPLDLWRAKDVNDFITANKIKLSASYAIQGRSFDLMNIARVYPLKHALPNDFKKICADFPLMEALCWVYEKRAKKYGAANLPLC